MFSVVALSVLTAGEALAWGPVTHQKIVEEAREETISGELRKLWTDYPEYMYGGAIAPDWVMACAMLGLSDVGADEVALHQSEFHSRQFLEKIKILAVTDKERAFYYAYESPLDFG